MPSSDLPPLTPETIQRAREELHYACTPRSGSLRDRSVEQAIFTALTDLQQIADWKI